MKSIHGEDRDTYEVVEGKTVVRCGDCGMVYSMTETPFCPHGVFQDSKAFEEYWDEHVAPAPDELRERRLNIPLPEYDPERGYRVTSLGDRHRLMKIGGMDYRGRRGMGERYS